MFLKFLKNNSYIINTSRFFSVDEDEVINQVPSGVFLGYATDSIDGEYDENTYKKNKFMKY